MNRAGRISVALFMAMAVLLAATVWRAAPALAEDGYEYGEVSGQVTVKINGVIKFTWYQCTFVGVWKVAEGDQFLSVSGGCNRGSLAENVEGYVYAKVPDCGVASAHLGNLDEKDEVGTIEDVTLATEDGIKTGTACGSPPQLCLMTVTDPQDVDPELLVNGYRGTAAAPGKIECSAWNVGAPPESDPGGSTGGTCPLAGLLRPYVTAFTAVGTTGSWYWQQTITLRVVDQTTGTLSINSVTAHLHGFVVYNAGGLAMQFPTFAPSNVDRDDVATGVGVSLEETTTGAAQLNPYVKITARTVTQTGAVGSVAAPVLRTAGYYSSPSRGAGASTQFGNSTTDLTAALWSTASSGSYANARNYAGHTKPSWCYAAWAPASVYPVGEVDGTPVDDYESGPADTDPAPYVPPNVTPPVIDVDPSDGCDPEATVCIDPGDDNPDDPPSLPDPEDESCDFSITDPGTWGGQIICALAAIAKAVIGALGELLDFLGGLLAALLDLLTSLFVPSGDAITTALDGLRDSLETGPLGDWTGSFDGAFSGGVAGSCHGPEVDLTTLGVPDVEPLRPFEACSGPMADAAVTVRLVATVTIGITGGLFIVRMLTSALGINVPSPGRKGAES